MKNLFQITFGQTLTGVGPVAYLRGVGGGRKGHEPPGGPNSFNFVQFLGKSGKIVCWRPPAELAPPSRGNPGSATGGGGFQ